MTGRAAGRRGGRGHGRNDIGGGRAPVVLPVLGPAAPAFEGGGRGGRGRGGGRRRGRGGRGVDLLDDEAHNATNPPLPPAAAGENNHHALQPVFPAPFVFPKCPLCDHTLLPTRRGSYDLNITSSEDMLRFGLGVMGLETVAYRIANCTRFRAHFGIGPEGIFAMFNGLTAGGVQTNAFSLLMAMNFLKCYETEPCVASRWRLQESSIRVKIREYVRRIQQLKETKV
jgi:hypothetical protein